MNGTENRRCGDSDSFGYLNFRNYRLVGKIEEAKERFKENAIEAVGWIGFVGFGIASVTLMMGV